MPVETNAERTAKVMEIAAGTQEVRKLIVTRELLGQQDFQTKKREDNITRHGPM